MKNEMIENEREINLVGAGKLAILFASYFVVFILFYVLGVYSFDAFQSVGVGIANWPVPSVIRSTFILAWETVPIMMLLILVNLKYLKLSWKQFLICTASFILTLVLIMEIFFWVISLG